mgnify:CR=1 FL=1
MTAGGNKSVTFSDLCYRHQKKTKKKLHIWQVLFFVLMTGQQKMECSK